MNLLDCKKLLLLLKGNMKIIQQEIPRSARQRQNWIVDNEAFCMIGRFLGFEFVGHEGGKHVVANIRDGKAY